MRTLSSMLLGAQKSASAAPYVKLTAVNKIAGVTRLDWERLYTGEEDDYFHALAIPEDGSLVRARISPPGDAQKLYFQRVAAPGPGSDFSEWDYTGQYNCILVAAASCGTEVSIFWVTGGTAIRRIVSTDCGVNWGEPETIDYTPTATINGLAAAYTPEGDLAVFFADEWLLFAKCRIGGNWQTKTSWDKSTGDLSGIAAHYDGDWNLAVTGKDTSGNYKLWSLVYGNGGDVPSGEWSDLKEFASAPADGDYEFLRVFMDKPDVSRCFYVEKYGGNEAYQRPFWSHAIPDTAFTDNLWLEPVPFDFSTEYGLAVAHDSTWCWLSNPRGVWRARLAEEILELSAEVTGLVQEAYPWEGGITVELGNDHGAFAPLPGPLVPGCRIEFSPGYLTAGGAEYSPGLSFSLESYEYTCSPGKSSLVLHGSDGWKRVGAWQARQQYRWNAVPGETSVRQIIEILLSKAGLRIETITASDLITDYCPDFTVYPGTTGISAVSRLLSFVPDRIFVEGDTSYLVCPEPDDEPVYPFGSEHPIFEGRYRTGALTHNRIQVEGVDPGTGQPVIKDSFEWEAINRFHDRSSSLSDSNIGTAEGAGERGETILRQESIDSENGTILIPVNCGQQLYDVISITDPRAGFNAEKRRIMGITLRYDPARAEYRQRLTLGKV